MNFFSHRLKPEWVISLGSWKLEHLAQHSYYPAIPPCLWLKHLGKLQHGSLSFAVPPLSFLICQLVCHLNFHLILMKITFCHVLSHSHAQLFETPWTVAHQSPLSIEFSRQEYQSGLPFPSLGDLPDPGIETASPALQVDSLLTEASGKPQHFATCRIFLQAPHRVFSLKYVKILMILI